MKHPKKSRVRARKSQGEYPQLTLDQTEYLSLFCDQGLRPKRIASMKKLHPSSVYEMRTKLIERGFMDKHYNRLKGTRNSGQTEIGVGNVQSKQDWELHGCAWRLPIIAGADGRKYVEAIGAGVGKDEILNCTCELNADTIEVHTKEEFAFRGETPDVCVDKSWDYLWRVAAVLEDDYGLILRKPRHTIRRFRGHFALNGSAIAEKPGSEEILVVDGKDGKIRFTIDFSHFPYPHAEFPHSRYGHGDARRYNDVVDDYINKESFLPSQLSANATETTAQLRVVVGQLSELAHAVKAGQEMQNGILSILKAQLAPQGPQTPAEPTVDAEAVKALRGYTG